jgi:hypothetical protein
LRLGKTNFRDFNKIQFEALIANDVSEL